MARQKTYSDLAELVEAPSLSFRGVKEGRPFDKLREVEVGA